MNWSVLLLLSHLTAISLACKQQERSVATPPSKGIVGGITPITKEDMNEIMFQDALTEVMKNLDEANECHSFRLVRVIEATKQVVAGMKYVVKLEVTPIYSNENDEECLKPCYLGLSGNKEATATIVLQPWREPKHHITFNPNSDGSADFSKSGRLFSSCDLPEWTILSPDEIKSGLFQQVVQSSIERLNENADRCFRYEFKDVIEGRRNITSSLNYEWTMKVNRIYDESMPSCIGACADECSGIEIYRASAFVSPPQSGTPKVLNIEYKGPATL
ncbi:Cystatin [Taenia solium]|uniref:Cystatin n=1 Tax=Taenia solium TaxID=6204 RepID=A0A088FV33_TAESO|nr:cystatin [Taenia solium]|eukprot:TsM_000671000 transcript=TsM_000671000 gene=TsM_000671000